MSVKRSGFAASMKKISKPFRKIPTVRESAGWATIPEMLEFSIDRHADNIAYITPANDSVSQLTYGRVHQYITKLARHLRQLGIEKGDHVAILGENRPEWGISFFAVSWIGAVAIPLDARASLEDHKFILSFSSAKAVILSLPFYTGINSIVPQLTDLKHVVLMDSIEEIGKKYAYGIGAGNIDPEDLLEILFTSGTTGNPKGVMLSHRNIVSNVDDMHRTIEYSPQDRAFSILPIHHSYECTGGMIATFGSGMSVYYARGLKPRDLLRDLNLAKPTVWLTAPLILEKLYVRIQKEMSGQRGFKAMISKALPKKIIGRKIKQRLGLENIRLIASGGAALPCWVSEGLNEYGLLAIQGYGLSEASPLITVNPPSAPRLESIGMVIPSDDVEIRDTNAEGEGEIAAKGPNIMKGYYKNKAATEETVTEDGWLLTGDIGYFDEDGYLYITGRKKFVIITKGGKNVHPEEIEEKLTRSPYIEEALVFSPDETAIQALIYPDIEAVRNKLERMGEEFSPEKVWELIGTEVRGTNRALEHYKKIRHFAIRLEEFPKTTTRKIKRFLFKNLNLKPETKII